MNALVSSLHQFLHLATPLVRLLVIALLAVAAWLVAAVASWAATRVLARRERRCEASSLRRRKEGETAISLVRTSVRYLIWMTALVLAVAVAVGAHGVQTAIGASFLAILLGFAAQRFLIDLIAGVVMFFEGWFGIGDTVRIEPWAVEGVVEEVSLRAVAVRGAGGELQRVHNSQVMAVKLFPRGYREAELDLVVRGAEKGKKLVEQVLPLLPVEPTRFVQPPELVSVDELGSGLVSMRLRVAIIPGREWLAEELLPALLREQADEALIVHGPVVSFVDEVAQRRFGRIALVGRRDSSRASNAAAS